MDPVITLPVHAGTDVLRQGVALCKTAAFRPLPEISLPEGRLQLQARVTDSFQFVDFPQLELDASGTAVSRYRCSCPDYRLEQRFCIHCAALATHRARQLRSISSIQTAAEEPELPESAGISKTNAGVGDFSFHFANSAWDLYPGQPEPQISQEIYYLVFGKNARAMMLYRNQGPWGGNCFGMAYAAAMLQQPDSGIRPADFHWFAKLPSKLNIGHYCKKLDLTVLQFIEALYLTQMCPSVFSQTHQNLNDPETLNRLIRRVRSYELGHCGPPGMLVMGARGGHALLPLHLSTRKTGPDILHLYDCNYPLETRYAYLEKDGKGGYSGWEYPLSEEEAYASKQGDRISTASYELVKEAWENRGQPSATPTLFTTPGVAICSASGVRLARVTASGVESDRADIFQIPLLRETGDSPVLLSLPAGTYLLCQEDPDQKQWQAALMGDQVALSLSTNARQAQLRLDEENALVQANISQPGCRCTLETVHSLHGQVETAQITDITDAQGITLAQKDGQLYARGISRDALVYVDDTLVPGSLYVQPLEQELLPQPAEEPEPALLTNGAPSPTAESLSYSFANSAQHLYPFQPAPRIPLERYYQVFGNNVRAKWLFDANPAWGGSCFGMTCTAGMLGYAGSHIWPSDFRAMATQARELKLRDMGKNLGMSLHTFIEAMHILQSCRSISDARNRWFRDAGCLQALAEATEAFAQGTGGPLEMGVWADARYTGGHSVLPFYLERCPGPEDKLHIYDPNWPLQVRYAYLEKDAGGSYIHWRFALFEGREYASRRGGLMAITPHSLHTYAWERRGSSQVDALFRLSTGSQLLDEWGNSLARVTEAGVSIQGKDTQLIPLTDGPEDSGCLIRVPEGAYTLQSQASEPELRLLDAAGLSCSVQLLTASRQASAELREAGAYAAIGIPQPNCPWQLRLCSSRDGQQTEYLLCDTTQELPATICLSAGQLYASGLSEHASLRCNGVEAALWEHIVPMEEEAEEEPVLLTNLFDKKKPVLENLSYSFRNSRRELYPGQEKPGIPRERYFQVFGKNVRALEAYKNDQPWSGNCFGMAFSAAMLTKPNSGVTPKAFRSGAVRPSQLQLQDRNQALGMELLAFLETAHILQRCYSIQQERAICIQSQHMRPEQLARSVAAFEKGGAPVAMDIFRSRKTDGGHTLLPYRLEKCFGREDRLHVYDPNHPLAERYVLLEKGPGGQYTHWRYAMSNEEYSSKTGGLMTVIPYEAFQKAWDSRGQGAGDALISVNAGVTVCTGSGQVLAKVTQEGLETSREDIYIVPLTHGGSQDSYLLSAPVGAYTFRLEDPAQKQLSVKMVGVDLSVEVTTDAREVSVCVNEARKMALARILQPQCSYAVEIMSSESGDFEQMNLTGITGLEGLQLMRQEGRLYAHGLDQRTQLRINGEPAALSQHIAPLLRQEPQQEQPQQEPLLQTHKESGEQPL